MFLPALKPFRRALGTSLAFLGGMNNEPFALQLYRRFLKGETIGQLSMKLGIPAERIEIRIRAAAVFVGSHRCATDSMEEWQTWA